MSAGTETGGGWIVTGFQMMVGLGAWLVVVLCYGLWRSLGRGEPDPIRPPGPVE